VITMMAFNKAWLFLKEFVNTEYAPRCAKCSKRIPLNRGVEGPDGKLLCEDCGL